MGCVPSGTSAIADRLSRCQPAMLGSIGWTTSPSRTIGERMVTGDMARRDHLVDESIVWRLRSEVPRAVAVSGCRHASGCASELCSSAHKRGAPSGNTVTATTAMQQQKQERRNRLKLLITLQRKKSREPCAAFRNGAGWKCYA